MFDFTLFEAHVNITFPKPTSHTLVLSGCKAVISAENKTYSELEELNFSDINRNDFSCGYMEIELFFENIFSNPYFNFNAKCFSIRTNNGVLIKCNGFINDYYTKISKEGKLAAGIRYYFHNEDELQFIKNCTTFLIEGFISFKKNKNVYGIMCELSKSDEVWSVITSNTYRPHKGYNIINLCH